jgi:BlaI family penicillinase repressor
VLSQLSRHPPSPGWLCAPMEPSHYDVTDAELAVLQALWDRGPATIRQLTDRLYPSGSTAHAFTATTDRDTLLGHRLRAMAERLCGGLLGPLLTHLVRAEKLSVRERQELRTLIEDLDREPPPRDRRR